MPPPSPAGRRVETPTSRSGTPGSKSSGGLTNKKKSPHLRKTKQIMVEDGPKDKIIEGPGGYQQPAEQRNFVEAIQSFGRQYHCAQQDRAQHDQRTFRWTKITGVGVWIYTILTLCIVGVSIYSAKIASDTEIRSLRAYVLIDSSIFSITQEGMPNVNITIKNFV